MILHVSTGGVIQYGVEEAEGGIYVTRFKYGKGGAKAKIDTKRTKQPQVDERWNIYFAESCPNFDIDEPGVNVNLWHTGRITSIHNGFELAAWTVHI